MITETPSLQKQVQPEGRFVNLIKQEFIKHAKEINRLEKDVDYKYYTKDEVDIAISEALADLMSTSADVIETLEDITETIDSKLDKGSPDYVKEVVVDGQNIVVTTGDNRTSINQLQIQIPEVPTKTSDLINDSNYISEVRWANIINRPVLSPVATNGSYNDLYDLPVIPEKTSELINDSGYITGVSWDEVTDKPTFATVATSGSYTDLSNKPTIPTVPTNVSAFNNDSGYITGVAWNDITNKPSTFTPSTHNHDGHYPIVDTSGLESIAANTDLNTLTTPKTYHCGSWSGLGDTYTNTPSGLASGFKMVVITTNGTSYIMQMIFAYSGAIYVRGAKYASSKWTFNSWRALEGQGHTHNYLPLSGGTLTGQVTTASNIILDKSGTSPVQGTAINLPFTYKTKTTASGNAVFETSPFFAFPSNESSNNGVGFGIQSGGAVVIGGGESPKALVDVLNLQGGTENLYLTADNNVYVFTKGNTIANRKEFSFGTDGVLTAPGGFSGLTKAQVTTALGYTPPTTNTTYTAGTERIYFLGVNPTGGTSNDTKDWWKSKGNCIAYFNKTGQVNGQPNQYGFLISLNNGGDEVHQEWWTQCGGAHYHRGGNGSTTAMPSWTANDTNTDNSVTATATEPTSAKNWYPICSTMNTTATGTMSKNPDFRVTVLQGTASAEGKVEIVLGNSTATGTAGNKTGALSLYNNKGKWASVRPHTGDTESRTIYTPKAGGTLVVHTTDTAIGSASKPVYVNANGVVTECTSIDSSLYTNTTYSSMSATEATTGTATTARLITAKVLHDKIKAIVNQAMTKNNLTKI